MEAAVERPNFSERCRAECTRDVIFLLQRRELQLLGLPDGFSSPDIETILDENGDEISSIELFRLGLTFCTEIDDCPCVIEHWRTEGVWLSRQEAERFAGMTAYNFPEGWRVYGTCANGELATLLKDT